MRKEPTQKRAMVFIDGQNLYHSARNAFGYSYPNFDPYTLAQRICASQGWRCKASDDWITRVHFYSGIPSVADDPFWNRFWQAKLASFGRLKGELAVHTLPVRYREQSVTLSNGEIQVGRVGQEKGIDIRLALDAVRYAHDREYDVAVIVSQDQDFEEVAKEIRTISSQQQRWIKIASAFPSGEGTTNRRGINGTDWIEIPKEMYDQCLDRHDYRPPNPFAPIERT